jgi:hypothetical protein
MNNATRTLRISALAAFAVLIIGFSSACKGPGAEKAAPVEQSPVISIDAVKPILGNALDEASGVLEVRGDTAELVVMYRYYDDDRKDYDDGLVKDLAPKIVALYEKLKSLDRVIFQISANDPTKPTVWKPYVNFALNRKIFEEVEWSNVLTADFFKKVIDSKRFD